MSKIALQCALVTGALVSATSFSALAFDIQGKYCDTPSRCINPATTQGMVTTSNYLATQSGLKVLREGGNAIDAAIAAAATLAVVYPHMTGIGGDSFWLIFNAKTGEMRALNASGRAAANATSDYYKAQGLKKIPPRGYLSSNTVPGAVAGWEEAYRYGQQSMGSKVSWPQLFEESIGYANEGFAVNPSFAKWSKINVNPADQEFRNLQRYSGFKKTYLKPNGETYQVGDVLKQSDLGKSLSLIAKEGAEAFYKGDIANRIVDEFQQNGGVLTLRDFAAHKSEWQTPLKVTYRDTVAYNLPPNTQGMASLEILNVLNHFNVKNTREGSADYYHLLIEATKEAFADRDQYLGDPDFLNIPLEFLLSPQHGKDQAKRINMHKAAQALKPLDPMGDTIWLGVVDKDGNAASLIQSVYYDFGSGIIPEGTGIVMQNRGSFFSLDEQHNNRLMPGKRTFHTLNPAMLTKNGKPLLVYGTMGGEGQPQTQAAIVTRIVDFGMSPQDAINAPRWLHGRTWGAATNDLKIEGRVPKQVTNELKKRGHPVNVVEDYTDTMGHAGAIWIDPVSGVRFGATDPRGDGLAAGH